MKKLQSFFIYSLFCCSLFTGCMHTGSGKSLNIFLDKGVTKRGKACARYILFFPIGFHQDTGLARAKKKGNISRISFYDKSFFSFLFYTQICTIVYGR